MDLLGFFRQNPDFSMGYGGKIKMIRGCFKSYAKCFKRAFSPSPRCRIPRRPVSIRPVRKSVAQNSDFRNRTRQRLAGPALSGADPSSGPIHTTRAHVQVNAHVFALFGCLNDRQGIRREVHHDLARENPSRERSVQILLPAAMTTVATQLPIRLPSARAMPMNQSIDSTSTSPIAGMAGTAFSVAARMTMAEPGTPWRPWM